MQELMEEDELDRQLREAVPYIDDAGFSHRVLHSLPARPTPSRLRGVILMLVTVLATTLAYFVSGGGRFVNEAVARLSQLPATWLFGLMLAAGLIVGAVGLAAALSKEREPALISR